jgi:hypothetical protein
VRRVRAPERRSHRRANDTNLREFGPNAAGHFLHGGLHRRDRGMRVVAEIVNPFEPNHGSNAGQVEHISFEPLTDGGSSREGLFCGVLGRPRNLVAADVPAFTTDT